MRPLTVLASCAAEFGINVGDADAIPMPITVNLVRPSGYTVAYELELDVFQTHEVRARERTPARLPSFCPERHINEDGSFCTHWSEGDPYPVDNTDDARRWWTLLLSYLERQETASRLRKWPGPTRAHGVAAKYQAQAETTAATFGARFLRDLENHMFCVVSDRKRGRLRLELLRNGKRVNRLTPPSNCVANPRMPCPCDVACPQRIAVGECVAHAVELARFIDALYRWTALERKFMRNLKERGAKCCGTLATCPLA